MNLYEIEYCKEFPDTSVSNVRTHQIPSHSMLDAVAHFGQIYNGDEMDGYCLRIMGVRKVYRFGSEE